MPLNWRPVGPEPESTYWQRRAVLGTAAVLLLAILTSLLTGGDDEPDELAQAPRPTAAPSASAGSSASATPSPSPTPSTSPSPAAACAAGALQIEADTDQDSYSVGATPRLTLTITNTGTAPCTSDIGQAAVELVVYSGKDRIWSSDDCAAGGAAAVQTLEPGKGEVQRVTWNGRRSLPGCAGEKAQAQAGTYRLHARVGEQRVEGAVFRLTD